LVKKQAAAQMGTPTDMRFRIIKRRVDNSKRLDKITQARKLIYEMGRSVQSKGVEELLKKESYVPTLVRWSSSIHLITYIYDGSRMHFHVDSGY
jgi:hypothetical protein